MKTENYALPSHWVCPMINDDYDGLEDIDIAAIEAFTNEMVTRHGQCWCLGATSDSDDFRRYHDASHLGVLACNVETFTFDVTKRAAK